jgi:hypothetical protein
LQLRASVVTATSGGVVLATYNGDSGANYTRHRLLGYGTATNASGVTGQTSFNLFGDYVGTAATPNAAGIIMDVLDYASTSKLKTSRILSGADGNGSGEIEILSSLYSQSSIGAITSMTFTVSGGGGNFVAGTIFALYGVK